MVFGMLSRMARRRSSPDPLATVDRTRWLVIRDRCSRPLRNTVLPPNSDLKAALAAERQRLVDEGWTADKLTRYQFVFCERGNERVCVCIECYEPGTAPLGHGSMIGRT
jgi:hypothetical protein